MSTFQEIYDSAILIPYGSRVYGTHNAKSDYDYLAIVESGVTGEEFLHDNTNLHVYTRSDFSKQLHDHKVHALEAYYLPDFPDGKFRENLTDSLFTLDRVKLRHEFCQKASNSFVKAKKKIEKEKDYYIGWKSLFHSLRILNFGIQIASEEKINYSAMNSYWFDILHTQQYNWQYFKETYQPVYNALATEFRKLAPKE